MFLQFHLMLKDKALHVKVLLKVCKGFMQFVEYFLPEGQLTYFSYCVD